jgi:hypothetical protein
MTVALYDEEVTVAPVRALKVVPDVAPAPATRWCTVRLACWPFRCVTSMRRCGVSGCSTSRRDPMASDPAPLRAVARPQT